MWYRISHSYYNWQTYWTGKRIHITVSFDEVVSGFWAYYSGATAYFGIDIPQRTTNETTHSVTHAHTNRCAHIHAHAHTHARSLARTHARKHTRTHARTHAHTHGIIVLVDYLDYCITYI